MVTNEQKQLIIKTLEPLDTDSIAIFGSRARGQETDKSDIDILIDTKKRFTLLDLIGLEQELSDLLKIKVDLVTKRSLSPLIAEEVLKDLTVIYE